MAPSFKSIGTAVQGTVGTSAAKAAAKGAAKGAAQEAAQTAAKGAAKQVASDTVESAAKGAAQEAAQEAAKTAAKSNLKSSLKETLSSARKSAGESLDSARKSATDFAKNNPKLAAGLAAAGIGGAYLLSKYEESTNTPRKIIKIEQAESGSVFSNKKKLRITFEPAIRITQTDLITFKGTKTTPSLDAVDQTVSDVESDQVIIYTAPKELTDFTEGGEITVKTSILGQAGDSAAQVAEDAGDAAGNVGEGAADALTNFFKQLSWKTWGIIGVVIAILILVLLLKR